MKSRTLSVCAAAMLLATPLCAQQRPVLNLEPVPHAAAPPQARATGAGSRPTDGLAVAMGRAGVDSPRQTAGNAALIAGGLAVMYLAYSEGEEGGGGFGTLIGVLGAGAFWAGIIRQVFH